MFNYPNFSKTVYEYIGGFESRIILLSIILILFMITALIIRSLKKRIKQLEDQERSQLADQKQSIDIQGQEYTREIPTAPLPLKAGKSVSLKSQIKKVKSGLNSVPLLTKKTYLYSNIKKKLKILSIGLVFINIFLFVMFVLVWFATFFTRPVVIFTSPKQNAYMQDGEQSIAIEFDVPVDSDSIEFNISPDDFDGEWEMVPIWQGIPLYRKAIFHPDTSVYPDQKVVVYVVNIRCWWDRGKGHEQSIEFHSPKIPQISEVIPADKTKNVKTDQDIEIEFDSVIGDFIDLDYKVVPEINYQEQVNHDSVELILDQSLTQDQTYKLEVYRTPRSYDVKSGSDIVRGETELVSKSEFSTVSTPLLEKYEPKGNSVLVDNDLEVVFKESMNPDSVESNFKIIPDILGDISWDDDQTMLFSPLSDWEKETKYTIRFAQGIKNLYGGVTDEKIEFSFTTIGKVKVASISPINGATGLYPKSTNIVVEFNQEVDHKSAQEHFSISPAISSGFSWDKNKMVFHSAGKLDYSKTYTITIGKGVKTVYGLDSAEDFKYSFSTRAQIFTLAVPYYSQQEMFSCNLAAIRMALVYRGIYLSEAQIKSGIGTSTNPNSGWVGGYGVHAGPAGNYIGKYRKYSIKRGWNVAELAKEVEKGNPVILWWYNRYSQPAGAFTLPSGATGYKGMHSEVVYGFMGDSNNPSYLYTRDPWRGTLTYSKSGFISTWAYLNYTAIVVY